jgi:biotin carboxyl carrier protein
MEEENSKPEFKILELEGVKYKTTFNKKFLNRKPYAPVEPGKIAAFIPGTIKKLYVRRGRKVEEGDRLLILEAMKMQNVILAPFAGKIKAIHVKKNQMVSKGFLMIEME